MRDTLVSFLLRRQNTLTKKQLTREKGLFLLTIQVQIYTCLEAKRQELEATGHITAS